MFYSDFSGCTKIKVILKIDSLDYLWRPGKLDLLENTLQNGGILSIR